MMRAVEQHAGHFSVSGYALSCPTHVSVSEHRCIWNVHASLRLKNLVALVCPNLAKAQMTMKQAFTVI